MREIQIKNKSQQLSQPIVARYCDTFFSRFRGLMFFRTIGPYTGALLVYKRNSIVDTGIHMLFMNFDIAVFWINSRMEVVDRRIARRWRSVLTPSEPAMYVLETLPQHYEEINNGDILEFEFTN